MSFKSRRARSTKRVDASFKRVLVVDPTCEIAPGRASPQSPRVVVLVDDTATHRDGDPIASLALLDGWQDHADDMTIDRLPDAGHSSPKDTH